MHGAGLTPRNFINLHIRHSVEKTVEGKNLKVSLPDLDAYGILGRALATDVRSRKVFVQTASPIALQQITLVGHDSNLEISFTNNSRSEHDAWGGWNAGAEMEQAAVAAVNALIGSQAIASVSPVLSLWTNFLWFSYETPLDKDTACVNVCCPLERCSSAKVRGGSHTLDVCSTMRLRHQDEDPVPLQGTRRACRVF